MNLWVDDAKAAPSDWAVARTYDDAWRLLRDFDYDTVALDHDLNDPKRTGYELLCAIERGELRRPRRVTCISLNPYGRRRIMDLIAKLYPDYNDWDLQNKTREELIAEVEALRSAIRRHRASAGHDLCWYQPELWALLPEQVEVQPHVPDWPAFMRGCVAYRESLDSK